MLKPMVLVYLTVLALATAGSYLTKQNLEGPDKLADNSPEELSNSNGSQASFADLSEKNEPLSAFDDAFLAQVAQYHHDDALALHYYQAATKINASPELAEAATELSLEQDDLDTALHLANHWATVAPKDLTAQLVSATLYLEKDPKMAAHYFNRTIELAPKEIDEHLLAIQMRLPPISRTHLNQLLQQLANQNPNNPYAQLVAAQSSLFEQDALTAETFLKRALHTQPSLTKGIELEAKLIRLREKSDAPALTYLQNKVQTLPQDFELRLFYTQALLDAKEDSKAIAQLHLLAKNEATRPAALILLGETAYRFGNLKEAEGYFQQLLTLAKYNNQAHYLLGLLYSERGDRDKALAEWASILEGEYQVPAVLSSAAILQEERKFDEALQLLQSIEPENFPEQKQLLLSEIDVYIQTQKWDEALNLLEGALNYIPYDKDFLMQKALLLSALSQDQEAEKTFLLILQIDPLQTDAMNALGFLLLKQPERREEAKQYIHQALKRYPRNPYYLDSMGWAEYLSGNSQQALIYLKQAHHLLKDTEISTHLAEVLWILGKKTEASVLWMALSESDPNNPVLRETLQRLNIKIKPTKMVAQ